MTSDHPPCCPLGGPTPPREAKKQVVCDVSADPVHRAASWLKLLTREGLSQDSVMTEARFPSCRSWHGLVSPGSKTGQTSGARRSNHLKARLAGTGLSKLLCTTNLKAFILTPYCMKQSQFRGTPSKFNS